MNKLKGLLVGIGVFMVGGVALLIAAPEKGTSRAELVDAGILQHCEPVHLECAVRMVRCRNLPDGGLRPKYGTVEVKGYLCQRNGLDVLVTRYPRNGQGEDCFEPIGDNACRYVTAADAGCTDPGVCDDTGSQPLYRAATDRCACRNPAAGQCRTPNPDGGTPLQTPLGATISPPFGGAGCVPKVCVELAGETGESWPAGCPQ